MESEPNIVKPESGGPTPVDILSRETERQWPPSVSGVDDSQAQAIELRHPSEQQKYNDPYEEFEVVGCVEENGQILIPLNQLSLVQSNLGESILFSNNNEATQTWTMSKSQQMQPSNFPEQVLALTQAAAKTNGHPEKYLSGWPFLSPYNLQMLKCEKCMQEFCSTVNHRRHFRGHRQFLMVEKDSMKNRESLATYWDKLPLDEGRGIVSLKNASIEDVSGILIISKLASFIRSPGFSLLPKIYLKAGARLLDIVGGSPSRFPLSSKELFSILDYASEMTFLCGGTALSLQKYIFGRDAGKIALDMKNLISCTSFMVELELVKAWIAHKDVEALRCQQLLMEEEEASRRRQAELLEKKKLKKLRQKEKRVKESTNLTQTSIKAGLNHGVDLTTSSSGSSSPTIRSDYFSEIPELLGLEPPTTEKTVLTECLLFENTDQRAETEASKDAANGEIHLSKPMNLNNIQADRDESEKSPMVYANGLNLLSLEADPEHVKNVQSDQESEKSTVVLVNGSSLQEQLDFVEDVLAKERVSEELRIAHGCSINEVMIGSISIKIAGSDNHTEENFLLKERSYEEKLDKHNSDLNVDYCSARKCSSSVQVDSIVLHGKIESKTNQYDVVPTDNISTESCSSLVELNDKNSDQDMRPLALSSRIVKAFLAKRWKEIMAEAHVTLSLRTNNEDSLENNGA